MPGDKLALLCVTTCKRPQMLAQALASLNHAGSAAGWQVKMLVLDNDERRTAAPVFEKWRATTAIPARYAMEPQRGLSNIRNRAIAEALAADADALVFFDDDNIAHPDCLRFLLEDMGRSGADIINGCVDLEWPDDERLRWLVGRLPPASDKIVPLDWCGTSLTAFSRQVIKEFRFDPQFNFTGGEDWDYSARARRSGFAIFCTHRARARDIVRPSRRNIWFLLRYFFRTHSIRTRVLKKEHGHIRTLARLLPQSLLKLVKSLLQLLLIPLSPRKLTRKFLKNFLSATGAIHGMLCPNLHQTYKQTDGH